MKINLIIAIDKNGVMGDDQKLPWRLRDDLKHFKAETNNYPLIMGSKTFKSLPGILPNREHLVLSSTLYGDENMSVFTSIKEALEYCEESNYEKVFVIGGANVVKQFGDFNLFDELIITHVDTEIEKADTKIDLYTDLQIENWAIYDSKTIKADDNNEYDFSVSKYIKINKRFY